MTTAIKTTTSETWSTKQTFAFAAVCLFLGICAGWLLRTAQERSNRVAVTAAARVAAPTSAAPPNLGSLAPLSLAQLPQSTDIQAARLLEKLKADPTNAGLLAQLGNLYYDAKQYPTAIAYYERSLRSQPDDTSVRTDMGTAYWYEGNADAAIAEFQKALSYEPSKTNALFNLGIVQWKGKLDPADAIASWQELLSANPSFEARAKVEEMIAEARASLNKKP